MKPMLAGKYEQRHVEKWIDHEGCYVQAKYDGIRVFIRDGIAYTRSLKPVRSTQVQAMIAWNKEFFEGLDGEMICGEPTAPDCYRRTMSSVQSYDKPDDDLRFYIFDRWESVEDFSQRWPELRDLDKTFSQGRAIAAETSLVFSIEDMTELERRALEQGHEGLILRRPTAYYKYGRGSPTKGELLKVKQFLDTEAMITGFKEEMENTNEATINELGHTERSGHQENLIGKGVLGAVIAEGVYENGTPYEVSIGSGFSHALRQELWESRQSLIGKWVKFKYFPTGSKEAPRFPTFLGLRDGDDMDTQGDLFS